MRGLGYAIRLARRFVGNDEVFAVLLGDTVMHGSSPLPAMLEAWQHIGKPSRDVASPAPKIAFPAMGWPGDGKLRPISLIWTVSVEKPPAAKAPRLHSSDGKELPFHVFAARYLFTPEL